MARKKSSPSRYEQVNVRLSPSEKLRLAALARQRGFRSVADYLRSSALADLPHYTYTVRVHPADPDEGGFWAEVPTLPGCNTQGETYEETLGNAKDAIRGYLQMLIKLGEPIPTEKQPKRTVTELVRVAV
jgi:predicted RNase H-like HicB family nuclease